jgi:signal transduction histidine kinase
MFSSAFARGKPRAEAAPWAASIAHEVIDDLAGARLYLELLRRRLSDDPGSEDVLNKIDAGMASAMRAAEDVLALSTPKPRRWELVDVTQLVDELVRHHEAELENHGIRVSIDLPPRFCIQGDRESLRRAVRNLLANAIDAMSEGGTLTIGGYVGPRFLELEIADDGPGLSDEARLHMFEPFYSSKPGGHGLGLAIVESVARSHGGDVLYGNCPEGGAAFTLRIPRVWKEAAA